MKKIRVIFVLSLCMGIAMLSCSSTPKVTLTEDVETYTMDNGIIKVRVSKVTGGIVSFRYYGEEMFETRIDTDSIPELRGDEPADNPNWKDPYFTGRGYGYWSHDAMGVKGSAPAKPFITINPAKNGGKMAEIAIKAISKGRKIGTGPGEDPAVGNLELDVEIRYTLEQNTAGVYTYSIFTHPEDYELGMFGEARHVVFLASFFDWMSIDKAVDFYYPKDLDLGDKYVYTCNQSENPAFGWSSTTKNVGMFFINPSMEYMGGGPTKVEFLGHRHTGPDAEPVVLNYWRSSHYGGAEANIAAGEVWNKIIGPVFIYANSGENPKAIYDDAKARAQEEIAKWPYNWVSGVDYPKANERATVSGQLVLTDPATPVQFSNLNVGLTAGEYVSPRPAGSPQVITSWQRDAKYYQFWTRGNPDGTFEISKIRPGSYTLFAFTDGVLGEFQRANIVVESGSQIDLGKLEWTPVRYGRQLWDIGIPNRNASEFYMADQRRDPEISLKYATFFPEDITYTIGKSDYRKDWFFQHVPHNTDLEAQSAPFYGIRAVGRATPYTILFDLPSAPKGNAFLRFAICGTGARFVDVEVNGKPAGQLDNLSSDGVITNHGSQGIWYERVVEFDAAMMKEGTNTLKIIVPESSVNNGMMYDYIRLELDES